MNRLSGESRAKYMKQLSEVSRKLNKRYGGKWVEVNNQRGIVLAIQQTTLTRDATTKYELIMATGRRPYWGNTWVVKNVTSLAQIRELTEDEILIETL